MHRSRTGLPAAALLFAVAGCVSDPAPVDVPSARTRWGASEPERYYYNVYRSCFCMGPHNVFVVASRDSVLSAQIKDSGSPDMGKAADHPQGYSIDSLFAQAEAAQQGSHHSLTIHFDATYGFPDTIAIDMVDAPMDGGGETVVANFRADKATPIAY